MVSAPGDITIGPPTIPTVSVPAPSPNLVVVPVGGPIGPQGPAGDTGVSLGFTQNVSTPSTSVTIAHGLPFNPSGIICIEADGTPTPLGIGISYPSLGQVRLTFGVPFTGVIYLS